MSIIKSTFLYIVSFLIITCGLFFALSQSGFCENRMTEEEIKRDYLSLIPSLVLIECHVDPEKPQNKQLCAREQDNRFNYYGIAKFEDLIRLHDEEGVSYNGGVRGGYQGGCVLVRIRAFQVSAMQQDSLFGPVEVKDVIESIYQIHYLPVYDACVEGELSDYGSAGNGMWMSP